MRATPFLSYPVEKGGPWDGLTGCAQTLEIMPAGRVGDMHLFHLMGRGVDEERMARLEEMLNERLHSVATIHHDRVTKQWQAQAFLHDDQFAASCLAAPEAMGAFEVPWIHVDGHGAQVRLLPASHPDLYLLHARLEKALGRSVGISYLDFMEYRAWVKRLHLAA